MLARDHAGAEGPRRSRSVAEGTCRWLLLVYLVAIPLPFGSVITPAQLPLIAIPILLATVLLINMMIDSRRGGGLVFSTSFPVFLLGAVVLVAVGLVQQVPIPSSWVGMISPASGGLWNAVKDASEFVGVEPSGVAYLSVAPVTTRLHLLRLIAYVCLFVAAGLTIRRRAHRLALATVLLASAAFQVIYGLKQFTAETHQVWGWRNSLIHDRVTGTYVNPNHFAHYLAIVLPVSLYVVMSLWLRRRQVKATLPQRIAVFLERDVGPVGLSTAVAIVCMGGILVAKSRGALLATIVGLVVCVSLLFVTRQLRLENVPILRRLGGLGRVTGVIALVTVFVTSLVLLMGVDRTVRRFVPTGDETLTLVGRTQGMKAAIGVWTRFPLIGSGLGTFEDVVLMEQDPELDKVFSHAHNDYLEVLATAGVLGFVPAITGLLLGWMLMLRDLVHPVRERSEEGEDVEWGSDDRRLFGTAALACLTTAMVHALFDFNFFIPANPATLAVIVGAAVSIPRQVRRTKIRNE